MSHINIEIKAKCSNSEKVREVLNAQKADFKGKDHQVDTYFRTRSGRLKLREGKIENNLIYYQRENLAGPKQSDVTLFKSERGSELKELLTKALGILVIVDKEREIYFIENVKFHIDNVKKLGNFVEIEAIDKEGNIGREELLKQCKRYLNLFEIREKDLIKNSYSDLLLQVK